MVGECSDVVLVDLTFFTGFSRGICTFFLLGDVG